MKTEPTKIVDAKYIRLDSLGLTPSPWILSHKSGSPPKIIQPGKAGVIAILGIPQDGNRTANGNLLLASRDLLDALRIALFAMERYFDYEAHQEEIDAARAAILKATGNENCSEFVK